MTDLPKNRYVLQKKLGGGGMGEVWLAKDTLLGRPVAIKYLMATQDAIHKELFLSEARTLASLTHPNITLIYDAVFDERQNRFFLVMEYVEGRTLANLIESWAGPLPLEIILDVTIGTLQALQYAHDKGIVHRDIKPANVIMQRDGVKLTDFGVAGLMSLLAQGSDYLVGTPAYMSPEQIDGQGIDGRADLYSLGVMLFEMVSGGHLPFHYSRHTEIFMAHLNEDPPSLRQFSPTMLPALEHVIMRLLAKEPAQRYPSAGAVLEVMRSIQARQKYSQVHLSLLEPEAKPFINRVDELARLEALWTETQKSATPQLVVIKGEKGIGKSRLVAEFLGQAVIDQEFAAVVGKCAEASIPYSPYAEILATILNKGLAKSVPTQQQMAQLLEHIPGLARLLNISPAPQADPVPVSQPVSSAGLWEALSNRMAEKLSTTPAPTQGPFFTTILNMLADLGPAVLFLEDATELDSASLDLTRFLLRQEQLPLLLIAACRDNGQPMAWLDSLASNERVIMTVSSLSRSAIRVYLMHLLSGTISEAIVGVLQERSHGHPLRLEEIVHHLQESQEIYQEEGEWRYQSKDLETPEDAFLPKAVFSAFTRQINGLAESHRQALALATMLEPGPEFEVKLWVTLLGGESQLEMANIVLAEATKKRLIRQLNEQRYSFRSVDIDKALASILTESRRRELHSQIAEILAGRQADPLLVAYHYEQAGLITEAAHSLEIAGAKAIANQDITPALDYYQRAVTLVESSPAYRALGQLYRQVGQETDSVRALQRGLELAETAGRVAEQAQFLNELALTLWRFDHYQEAYQRATAVLELAGIPERERAVAQTHVGMILWLLGRLNEAGRWGQRAMTSALQSSHTTTLAEVYYLLGLIHLSQGNLIDAQIVYQRSLELYRKLEDRRGEGRCLTQLGRVALERGDFSQTSSLLDSAQQLFETIHDRDGELTVYTQQGRALLYQGQPDEALLVLNKALVLVTEIGQRNAYRLGDIYLLIAQANLAVEQMDRARTAIDNALKLVKGAGNREYIALAQATLAQLHARQGDRATAETLYQKALTLFEQVGSQAGLLRTQLNYAKFLGSTARATTLKSETRTEAAQLGLYLPE